MKHLLTLMCLVVAWATSSYGQYCIPTYATGPTVGDSIVSVTLGTLVGNYPGDPSGYNDYTLLDTADIVKGQTYTATIVNNPTYSSTVSLWIDFDQDSVFSPAELLGTVFMLAGETQGITFTVPAWAVETTTRMRMSSIYSTPIPTPCMSTTYGETEDYSVTISATTGTDAGIAGIAPFGENCDGFAAGAALTAYVDNFGGAPLSNVDVYYSVNGGTPVVQTIPSIAGGTQDTFTFTTLVPMPTPFTTYDIEVWVVVPGDLNAANDTSMMSHTTTTVASFPMYEPFETFPLGLGSPLPNGWITYGTDDGWTGDDGPTGSTGTGPNEDHTTNGTHYMYTEATGGDPGDMYYLISPCIDMTTTTGASRLSFWYHMHGVNMGELEVHLIAGGLDSTLLTLVGEQQSNEADAWKEAVIDISNWNGEMIKLQFVGIRGIGFESDIAIDDINLYSALPVDAGVVNILTSPNPGCYSANDSVNVVVQNKGYAQLDFSVNSMTVTLDISGAATQNIATTVTSGTLDPDSFMVVTLFGVDFSTVGLFDLEASTSMTLDTNTLNDSSFASVSSLPSYTNPLLEDFETLTSGSVMTLYPNWWSTTSNSGSTSDGWRPDAGGTGSTGTGPSDDHTVNGSIYMYVEASSTSSTDTFELVSPCLELSTLISPELTFWYHMHGSDIGTLDVLARMDTGDALLWTVSGEQHTASTDPYSEAAVDLSTITGTFKLVFRVYDGGTYADVAVDDINIKEVYPNDAGIAFNFLPESGCGLTNNEDIVVALANLGTDSILGGGSVFYEVELGGSVVSSGNLTSNDTIIPGGFVPFTIGGQPFGTAGAYTITVWTSGFPGDTNLINDTLEYEVISVPTVASFPYFQDFELGPEGWYGQGTASSWVLGTPQGPSVQGAASGVNAWVTGDSSSYSSYELSEVLSPCFDFSTMTTPMIEFMINYATFGNDGAVLQSTIDGGATWQNVGAVGDPDNWFNNSTITGNPGGQQDGWEGNSGGWVLAVHELNGLGGEPSVRLRVAFGSTASSETEGFAFDDVLIYDRPTEDLGVIAYTQPTGLLCTQDSLELALIIENFGINDQWGFPVEAIVTDPMGGTFTMGSTFSDTLDADTIGAMSMGNFPAGLEGIYQFVAYPQLVGDTMTFNDTLKFSIEVYLTPDAPLTFSDSVCNADSATFTLAASGSGLLRWYDINGDLVAEGDTFHTPFISQTTDYFVTSTTTAQYGNFSPVDNTFGNGNTYPFMGDGLVFDALTDIIIDSVTVYPLGPGLIGVTLSDNTGAVIKDTLIAFGGTVADTTLNIDFAVPAGIDYELSADGTTTGELFRNNSGAVYPYEVPDIISITSAINNLSGYYYFFYDWVVTANGCESDPTPVQAIILDPVPVDLGADGTVCSGEVLDATYPSVVSYIWNGDSSLTQPTLTVDTTGMYTVDVVDVNGCTGSDTVVYFVTQSPVVDLGPDTAACDSFLLDAGNPGGIYVWSDPAAIGQTYSITQTGLYWVSVTANGCTSTDTVEVEINPSPMVDLGADLQTCLPVVLDAGAGTGYTYLWTTGETTQTINFMPPVSGTDTLIVEVTNPLGCVSSDTVWVHAGALPTLELGADTVACDSVELAVVPEANWTYTWSDGTVGPEATFDSSGLVALTFVDEEGCENSDSLMVSLNYSPTALAEPDSIDGLDLTIDFVNQSTPINGTSFHWEFGTNDTSTAVNPTYEYPFPGTFLVTLTATNECGSSTYEFMLNGVSIDDELFGGTLNLYPNPTNGRIQLVASQVHAEQLRVSVLDMQGRMLEDKTHQQVFGGWDEELDLSPYAEGVYFIRISDGDRVALRKVMLTK
ncbi:GEVED domain-containing protein [Pontibacter sp. G13]|uniref:GEVED domain-containing protein n=1 Tax=Pontibacter sp. G13 TaxID=3074898 RepID=UPI00288B6601|nr:GEVED domain-containing protein [Pontibacter sp. G13]WNJ17675.1 GEVED domain-containing protein [Pontibacter sp. G13]